jgi:pyruvate/2-oxoglutarate dehydrogenase complex dihydrolipoamide acyltransferase (E2) component
MSKFEFKLPDIGEGVSEGEIVNWLVKVGDGVKEDQDLVEVMTDKATVTIGSPKSGKVSELKGDVGDVVPVGQVLVVFDVEGGAAEAKPAAEKPAAKPAEAKSSEGKSPESKPAESKPAESKPAAREESKASAVGDIKEDLPGMSVPASRGGSPASSNGAYFNDKPLAAPATRKLARELDVDLRKVAPSGPNERVTREDVEAFAKGGSKSSQPAAEPARAKEEAPAPSAPRPVADKGDEHVPIRGMKKRMFEAMTRSKRTAAHFTYWEETEVSDLMALRERLKPLADSEGVKLNFLPLIVKAVVAALRRNPGMNAVVDDEKGELIIKHTYDIGIAVATDNGLIVPVLRGADQRGIVDISREIDRLSSESRAGKARREDLGGSSFTITSLGKLGGSFATPVINYPEVGILYIPQIKQKPVVKNGQIVIGNTMNLGMSFDHRVVDGATGASFTQDVAAMLQDPDRLLLNM